MQNIQMMRSEPRKDNPSINIVTWSGMATGEDKVEGKQPASKLWFRRTGEKNVGFDLHKEKETFMEARNNFMSPGASTSQNPMLIVSRNEKPEDFTATQDLDPIMLKSFLQTCVKLL